MKPRPLDHLVLPVGDLSVARARLAALGFTVAPEGVHPFGTANCCVYFADGTFLEPLAVADRALAARTASEGNVFTARDGLYRSAVGDDGFSALVVGTDDARGDHAQFEAAGVSAGQILDFSRPFVDSSGRTDTASFRLAFAAEPSAPDAFFFACQRVNVPKVDRSALQAHANGVVAIAQVLLSAEMPGAFAGLLSEVAGAETVPIADGIAATVGQAKVAIAKPERIAAEFAIPNASASRRLVGVIFVVASLAAAERRLRDAAVAFQRHNGRLVVQPAPGQGATFLFEGS